MITPEELLSAAKELEPQLREWRRTLHRHPEVGFDLPQTGGMGNWMFPVFCLFAFALCVFAIFMVSRKKKAPTNK